MDFNFDFNVDSKRTINIGIMELGLVFNNTTIKALGSPKKINIGIDSKNKVIGIKASKGNSQLKEFKFVENENQKWIRVNSKPLVKEIESITGLKFNSQVKHFKGQYNSNLHMIIVNLD